jgi:murein DD-endopeptidase MepM/ murein hydrolase activator NlpD
VSFSVLALNSANPGGLKNQLGTYLKSGSNVGGELTEIVSAPKPESSENNSIVQSALGVSVVNAVGDSSGIYEDSEFYSDPLITGQDSLLQNQNPITVPTIEPPHPTPRPAPYFGPSLDGYFIFPTTGYNQGRLHSYNAVDISRGDDCLYENIPVFAAASGVVTATYPTQSTARWANGGYGNYFIILHPNGVVTLYSHLKSILVTAGQYVNQGSIVAFMGGYPRTSGAGNSTGCHLHFGVRGAAQPFAR